MITVEDPRDFWGMRVEYAQRAARAKTPGGCNWMRDHGSEDCDREIEELEEPSGRVRSAQAGGKAHAAKLTKRKRSEIARKAAKARWVKSRA